MKRRLLLIVLGAALAAGCGSTSNTASTGAPVGTKPQGDADAIAACTKVAAAAFGPSTTVAAGFTTTEGVVAQWKQTREPGLPAAAADAAQLASTRPSTVCYLDGNFPTHGAPPPPGVSTTAPALPWDRAIIEIDANGQAQPDRTGPSKYLPIRRPAANAQPLNTATAPAVAPPPDLNTSAPAESS